MAIGQWKHQAVIRKHIEALGGVVELGSALLYVGQEDECAVAEIVKTVNGKEVTERAKFEYIIGADGGHSTFSRFSVKLILLVVVRCRPQEP